MALCNRHEYPKWNSLQVTKVLVSFCMKVMPTQRKMKISPQCGGNALRELV